MLKILINRIKYNELITQFDNIPVNLPTIEKELIDARNEHKKLVAALRVANYTKASTIPTEEIAALEEQDSLVSFLEFSKSILINENQESPLFMLALRYWLALPVDKRTTNHAPRVNDLFMALLTESAELILEYYAKNKSLFIEYPQIQAVAENFLKLTKGVEQINEHQQLLQQHLAEQENPLGLLPLFKGSINETEKLAALLLWLIERNSSIEAILQTQLLHDFFRYNMYDLSSEDSAINYLYQLLSHFPQAIPLIEQAKITSCDERGFQRYALDGKLKEEGSLQSISTEEPTLDFSPTANNFNRLYQLFGSLFLYEALNWLATNENDTWFNFLQNHLNSPARQTTELPTLINHIAKEDPQMLELLASLITAESLERLLSLKNGAVMHLLPYNPELLDNIDTPNLEMFIEEIRGNISSYDLIAQLSTLFNVSLQRQHEAVPLIFDAIIDSLYQNTQIIDDEELITLLNQYPYSAQNLRHRCENLQQRLDDAIIANTSDAALSTQNYHLIEDMWHDSAMKLRVLNGIMPALKVDPYDKYSLYIRIVQSCINQHGQLFDLGAFIQAIELPDSNSPSGASLHERVYVELLCAIDDQNLRRQLVNLLNNSDWNAKEYGGLGVFIKAAQEGNAGLIQLLVENYYPEIASIELAISVSANAGHWKTLNYLLGLSTVQLEQEQLINLLTLAVEHGQPATLQQLSLMDSFECVSCKIINRLLERATAKGSLDSIKLLCELPSYTLKIQVVNKLFQIALKYNHLEILAYFCNCPCPPMQAQVDKAFELAATTNNLELVKLFCSSENCPPGKEAIKRVLNLVSALGFPLIVKYLRESNPNHITHPVCADAMVHAAANGRLSIVYYLQPFTLASASSRALNAAIKNHRWPTANYICNLSAGAPHIRQIINANLLLMAKEGNLSDVKKLLLLKTKPLAQAVEKALLEAVKHGHLSLTAYLLEAFPPSIKLLSKALIEAANCNNLTLVSYLCELEIEPDLRIMKEARRRCISKHHTEIADYLSERIKDLASEAIEEEKEGEKEQLFDTTVDKLTFAPKLTTYGVFSSPLIKRATSTLVEMNSFELAGSTRN